MILPEPLKNPDRQQDYTVSYELDHELTMPPIISFNDKPGPKVDFEITTTDYILYGNKTVELGMVATVDGLPETFVRSTPFTVLIRHVVFPIVLPAEIPPYYEEPPHVWRVGNGTEFTMNLPLPISEQGKEVATEVTIYEAKKFLIFDEDLQQFRITNGKKGTKRPAVEEDIGIYLLKVELSEEARKRGDPRLETVYFFFLEVYPVPPPLIEPRKNPYFPPPPEGPKKEFPLYIKPPDGTEIPEP